MLSAYFTVLHKNIAFKTYNNQNTEHITVLRTADRSLDDWRQNRLRGKLYGKKVEKKRIRINSGHA
jgi:hypothetical protein